MLVLYGGTLNSICLDDKNSIQRTLICPSQGLQGIQSRSIISRSAHQAHIGLWCMGAGTEVVLRPGDGVGLNSAYYSAPRPVSTRIWHTMQDAIRHESQVVCGIWRARRVSESPVADVGRSSQRQHQRGLGIWKMSPTIPRLPCGVWSCVTASLCNRRCLKRWPLPATDME